MCVYIYIYIYVIRICVCILRLLSEAVAFPLDPRVDGAHHFKSQAIREFPILLLFGIILYYSIV